MGLFKKLFGQVGGGKKARIVVVGLDNSGKSTVIAWLKPKKVGSLLAPLRKDVPVIRRTPLTPATSPLLSHALEATSC
jgi:ribosome biogenesis GTPase A